MVTSRTFMTGAAAAIRLPNAVAFNTDTEVTIIRSGDVLTIYPSRSTLADLIARLAALPRPETIESRDIDPLPERPGL